MDKLNVNIHTTDFTIKKKEYPYIPQYDMNPENMLNERSQ